MPIEYENSPRWQAMVITAILTVIATFCVFCDSGYHQELKQEQKQTVYKTTDYNRRIVTCKTIIRYHGVVDLEDCTGGVKIYGATHVTEVTE